MGIQPTRFFHLSLIFLVALNLVPHFNDYTVPTLAVGGLCLVWRLLYEYQYIPLPNFWTKLGLVITLTYLVYQNYGRLMGLEAGSALLICAVSLKLIDRVAYRDAMVLLFLNFMLLLARFFESQTLGITIFSVFDLIITTALLVQLHHGARMKFDVWSLLRTGGKLFIQVAPLMILLFFVFPRFSTNFFGISNQGSRLKGFGDSMQPGSVGQLAGTNQPAFRVRFKGKKPSPFDRYWRGAVFAVNGGMKWERGEFMRRIPRRPLVNLDTLPSYELLLEPSFGKWLFALDKPLWIEHRSRRLQALMRVSSGQIYGLEKAYNKTMIYDGYRVEPRQDRLSDRERAIYLATGKDDVDPRVQELVSQINQGDKDGEVIGNRLMLFYQKNFRYTLNPGQLKTNGLAEFLFEKRVGFCEHFATSFASLMRLAGVPSRVVLGFQGGRMNALSDYMLVTSKDAHAWTEIWSEAKQQWLRFDPTVMVSPLRLELGGEVFHSLSSSEQLAGSGEEYLSNFDSGFFRQAYLAVDAMATNWNMFLLNFDKEGQRSFFARLGFQNVNQNLLLLVSLLLLLCFFLYIRLTNKKRPEKESEAQKAYMNLRRRLAKQGVEKSFAEGPQDFLKRCQKEYPHLDQQIQEFSNAYLAIEYGEKDIQFDFKKSLRDLSI